MSDERFGDVMRQERERFNSEREEIFRQQKELENKLAEIDRELAAIDAYEAAKSGKQPAAARTGRSGRAAPRARRGSKREAILQLIREDANGLSRGQILDRMNLKGDKSGEVSVSNALTALTKSGQVMRREGKYRVA